MTRRLPLLDRIDIPSPCSAGWNAMTGDALTRYCESCSRDVHDLSALTRRQAEGLIRRSGGHLCARISRDAEGRIRTAAAPVRLRRGPSPGAAPLPVWAANPRTVQRASRAAAMALAVALMAASPVAAGQNPEAGPGTGSVNGSVKDLSGAVIAGAQVTLIGAGHVVTGSTDPGGQFRFDAVPPGSYELTIAGEGFNDFHAQSFVVANNESEVIEAGLLADSEVQVEVLGGLIAMTGGSKAHCYVWKTPAEEEVAESQDDAAPELPTPPLLAAIELGEEELREALEAGASANERFDFGRTPLMHAADDEDLVRLLLEKGADPTTRDEAGATALHYAALADDGGSVFALCRAGADANATDNEGVTPLILAAWDGNEETVAALLAAGADVRTRDRRGRSALDLAREAENDEMIEILEVAGAK